MITLKQLKDKLHRDFGWKNLDSDDNKSFVDTLLKDAIQAIEITRCCKSDSEQLVCEKCNGNGGYSYVDKKGFNYKTCECQTN